MTPARRGGEGALFAPVVIERAGGGLARVADEPAPLHALRGLVREGAEILGAERTAIWRMGPAGMPLRCLTRFHRSSGTHEDDVAYPDELGRETWRLLERLSVLAMDDVRAAPSPTPVFRNYLQEAGIRAILAVPIRYQGNLAGYLAFEETDGPRPWTPRDRSQASTLAFRLERHWGRVGTSVGPGAGGGDARRSPTGGGARTGTDRGAPGFYRERADGQVVAPQRPSEAGRGSPAVETGEATGAVTGGATGTGALDAAGAAPAARLPDSARSGRPSTGDGGGSGLSGGAPASPPTSPDLDGNRNPAEAHPRTAEMDLAPTLGGSPPRPSGLAGTRAALTSTSPAPEPPSARFSTPVPDDAPSRYGTGRREATEPSGGMSARSSSFGHRRELRARLQRLRTLERTGILGTRSAREALHWMDVQEGTLALLEDHLSGQGPGRELLDDAREALDRARDELVRHLGWARRGLSAPAPLELNGLVGRIAVRLGKITGERVGLLYAPASEPVWTAGDAHLLERTMEELVRNARAASAPGDRVRIGVQRGDLPGNRRVARLVVEDRGTGIAAANLPWIFEPWFSTRDDGADGYGLPYVQAVVEGHGGWVDVTSTEGRGSIFTLNLPLVDAVREDAATSDEAESVASREGKPPRPLALVVEDDELTARLLRHALEGAGFRTLLSSGGPEALRLVREEGPSASVLLVERLLADGTEGVELLRSGREVQPYLGGIILDRRLRAGGDPQTLLRIREGSGIPSDVALVPAPFHPASLVSEVRRLSARREAAEEASRRREAEAASEPVAAESATRDPEASDNASASSRTHPSAPDGPDTLH